MIIRQDNYGNVSVVKNEKGQHGVMGNNGDMIVPFGRYAWISGFDHGLARVKSIFCDELLNPDNEVMERAKWGIIDESGQVVLPLVYDEIWNFFQKGRSNTKVVLGGDEKLFNLNSQQIIDSNSSSVRKGSSYSYGMHYGKYAGFYAQDVAGFSDDVIEDAFDGNPDAYWNVD